MRGSLGASRSARRSQRTPAPVSPARAEAPAPWPLWSRYASRFIAWDGRVIDFSAQDHTTSEGQAYALFFALVAGDRTRFDRLLRWTDDNLAGGALGDRLPANAPSSSAGLLLVLVLVL